MSNKYAQYEDRFDPIKNDRKARRIRKPKAHHVPKRAQQQVMEEVADLDGLEGGFKTTYTPALFEQGWLLSSIETFYDQALISDVLGRVKGGKEASVYRCEAHPSMDVDLLAAKVYRPRMFRNLRNDKMYREGRQILTESGRAVKETDHRVMRAIGKKSSFGQQVEHTSWLMHEFMTLQKLYDVGAAVPRPYAVSENSILMSYHGNESIAAPTLNTVRLDTREAARLCNQVFANVELMLQHGMIHGDLSAYNILYWEGQITLIDFPQVTNPSTNKRAYFILQRDIQRLCEYFAAQGVHRNANSIAQALWDQHVKVVPDKMPMMDDDDLDDDLDDNDDDDYFDNEQF